MAPKAAPEASNAAPTTKEAAGVLKRSSAYSIDARTITRRAGWNPRFDFGEIEGLATSLLANGMLNPIRVKRIAPTVLDDGKGPTGAQVFNFELIDGDRRLTAVELLIKQGKYDAAFPQGIPAIIVDKAQEDKTSLIQMFEANSGKPFLPLEEAAAYKRMREEFKMTIKEICATVGRRATHVNEMLALLEADQEVQDAVQAGEIGKTEAKRIAKVAQGDKAKQRELAQVAKAANKKSGKGNKGAVRKAIDTAHREAAAKKGRKLKIRALSDGELAAIGSDLAEHLMKLMEAQDIPLETDIVAELVKNDPELIVIYTAGALDALKVAAGGTNNLKL